MMFSRNTLTQLESSGNMRLIRRANVADSPNGLDSTLSVCNQQLGAFIKVNLDNDVVGTAFFDQAYFIKNGKRIAKIDSAFADVKKIKYLTDDKKQLLHLVAARNASRHIA